MSKVAIVTDSNSGITQAAGKELGVGILPMPFFIDGEEYRLADVFVNGFKANKINSDNFVNWIKSFAFDPYSDELLEYYRFNNLKSLLQDIYVKLNSISLLDLNVKEIVEKKFNSEY